MLKNLFAVLNAHPEWNWEVILIEDGSKDRTLEALRTEVPQYPNTKLLIHEQNKGYTSSLKDGIRASRGKYLMYIGADEEFDSSEIPDFIEILRKNETDVLLGVRWQRNAYQLLPHPGPASPSHVPCVAAHPFRQLSHAGSFRKITAARLTS